MYPPPSFSQSHRYNALQEHAAFQEGLHTCGICMEEQPGRAFARLDCRHAWCRGCLAEQARIHVAEGSLDALRWAPWVLLRACLQRWQRT